MSGETETIEWGEAVPLEKYRIGVANQQHVALRVRPVGTVLIMMPVDARRIAHELVAAADLIEVSDVN